MKKALFLALLLVSSVSAVSFAMEVTEENEKVLLAEQKEREKQKKTEKMIALLAEDGMFFAQPEKEKKQKKEKNNSGGSLFKRVFSRSSLPKTEIQEPESRKSTEN